MIEDKASGQSLIQDLKLDGYANIFPIKPKLDKVTRFASVTICFESGMVVLPEISAYKRALISELTNFPSSKNDDIVDSVSQFLNFIKKKKEKKAARVRAI